jgi:hypothetical protein
MFERYTEPARRLIFFARWEAAQAGSPRMEPEHLALALLRDNLILRLLPDSRKPFEAALREAVVQHDTRPTSVDLPLSESLKRVLANGAAAAVSLDDPQIRTGHLLLGLLQETDCPAVGVIAKFGITEERVLRDLDVKEPSRTNEPGISRETLSQLVATLPEGAFEQAHAVLKGLQAWPPARKPLTEKIAEARKKLGRSILQAREAPGPAGANVTETHRVFDGHEIATVERVKVRPEKKVLSWSLELQGPGREERFEVDFEIA